MKLNLSTISSQINPLFVYLQKKRENQKIVRSVELGGTFFLISFFILFAIKPTFLTISALVGDIKAKEVLSKELKKKINDVIVAQDLFSQVQERYSLVESSLPLNLRFYQANSQILGSTTKYQIPSDKFDYTMVKDQNYYGVTVNAITNFTSAFSMVSDILKNRRLIDVSNISFSINDESPGQINMVLPLKIYYWRDDVKK